MIPGTLGSTKLPIGPYIVFLVTIVATIPWRKGAYYQGGFDSVVLAKAGLSVLALAMAVAISRGRPIYPRPVYPIVLLVAYLTVSVLGALATNSLAPSLVISVRVLILIAIVTVLAHTTESLNLIGALVAALATVGVVAVFTGLSSFDGRLAGGIPPLHPNEIASTASLCSLWFTSRVTTARDKFPDLIGLTVSVAVLVATGSRTSLAACLLAMGLIVLHTTRLRIRSVALALIALPVVMYVAFWTGVVGEVVLRGQSAAELSTLSNRTIAWTSALGPKSTVWLEWFGGGLALKRLEVPGQWWNEQILDSSWISAIVQSGWIGAGLCVLLVLVGLGKAVRASEPQVRKLGVGILSYLAIRGILESGLFDASTAFLALLTALMLRRGSPFMPVTSPRVTTDYEKA